MVHLILPDDGALFDTYTDEANAFISIVKSDGIDSGLNWLEKNRTHELSYPRGLDFSWEGDGGGYIFEISERADFKESRTYHTNDNRITLLNLKTGVEYFWRVNCGEVRSFSTKKGTPRFLRIDGLLNVRDIGGGKIKQGILFRGCELERCFSLTERGRDTFLHELGIKTQLDLRLDMKGKLDGSAAGEGVRLVQLSYRPYGEVFLPEHIEGIRPIMELFADPDSYPVYFHCMGGADRTGMIALYLRALAGEDDDTIHLDYELTGLSLYAGGITEGATGLRSRNSGYYSSFIKRLREYSYDGAPLREAVRGFLVSCGISSSTLDKIAENITEPK